MEDTARDLGLIGEMANIPKSDQSRSTNYKSEK
jgi:hypothetical protein